MHKKAVFFTALLLLMSLFSFFGLSSLTGQMKRHLLQTPVYVTVTPEPVFDAYGGQ